MKIILENEDDVVYYWSNYWSFNFDVDTTVIDIDGSIIETNILIW